MQYNKNADSVYEPLKRKCVDTGMGIERTIVTLNKKKSVYDTDIFAPLITAVEKAAGFAYSYSERAADNRDPAAAEKDRSMRIICDHVRSSVLILGDHKGPSPSNIGAGYILRRLIRRAVRHGRKLGIDETASAEQKTGEPENRTFILALANVVIEQMKGSYPELEENRNRILEELDREVKKFLETLQKGEHEFEKLLPNLLKDPKKIMSGRLAFRLYDTYGFPIELTEELAAENGLRVNREEFEEAFKKHQELSRAGSEQIFKGGLGDHGEIATRYHTATHLLHQALRTVLGNHVAQKGSNITAERMRFDFSHNEPMTGEQLEKVQEIVNEQIKKDLPVKMEIMDLDSAVKSGAVALFGEKYESQVKVYTIGNSFTEFFSKEVCGGPHVGNTGVLGKFVIQKEQSSSSGVRRIRAVLEQEDQKV